MLTVTITRDPRNAEFRKAHRKANMYERLYELTKNNVRLEQLNDMMFDKCSFWRRKTLRILDQWCNELETKLLRGLK